MSTFLLVDDDLDDQEVFKEALDEISPSIILRTALNGEDALAILENELYPLPDYIFLDLNMPRMNGHQCLSLIKNNERLKNLRVIIYTTSYREKDKNTAELLGASNFFTKPTSITELKKTIESLMTE